MAPTRHRGTGGPGSWDKGSHPRYVAIITDGNGRWARARGVPVNEGHSAGADTVKARLRDAAELGIEELTVYSFSTENWSRPAAEVEGLMAMFPRRIAERDARAARRRACGCASSGAARGSRRAARRADELGGRADRGQPADHAVRGLQLRRARGDPRRRAALSQGSVRPREEFRQSDEVAATRPRCTIRI